MVPDQIASKKPADLDLQCVCCCFFFVCFFFKYIRTQRVKG